jgi:ABC-type uncharacterized transport system substrate-binding protein
LCHQQWPLRYYVAAGGLISYGPDPIDQYRHAAGYVDGILQGETPADLPVEAPVKNLSACEHRLASSIYG